ncbi:hypothetical protein ACS0TY_036199 [Phlomoides rotata]
MSHRPSQFPFSEPPIYHPACHILEPSFSGVSIRRRIALGKLFPQEFIRSSASPSQCEAI